MPNIILEGHIVVAGGDLPAVTSALPTHIQLTRQEAGCLCFEVTQNPNAENIFFVYEEFIDRAAFEKHQRRLRSSEWGRVAANVQRHYQVREVD
tara:strand:+ start:466 stop:747 length:282 start_codon:yes stop_codon:yes gene_type:complete